jgi:2-polyprenyl-6-methoxyphenol hydroxylase-like FAD-dependent oxidoreductase
MSIAIIGGMSLALSLQAAGLDDLDVYETASAIRELGVGINVLPHAIRELTELDLLDELSRVGVATADSPATRRLARLSGKSLWAWVSLSCPRPQGAETSGQIPDRRRAASQTPPMMTITAATT